MSNGKQLIRLTSRALGSLSRVRVYVYEDGDRMRADATAFSGCQHETDVLGVTHAWTDDKGRAALVTMRLIRGHLSTEILSHEMHHASTALYGATLPDSVDRAEHFTHFNEPHAYLHGQLLAKLVDRLYVLGYYE